MNGSMDGSMDRWMDQWIDGWMDGRMNERMDRQMDRQTLEHTDSSKTYRHTNVIKSCNNFYSSLNELLSWST